MKLITLSLMLLMGQIAFADLEQGRQEYLKNKCILNSVDLWFVHTCKDVAYEAGKILQTKGYRFTDTKVEITVGGQMQNVLTGAQVVSINNPSRVLPIDVRDMVGKVVAYNVKDKNLDKYLVLAMVSPSLDLVAVSSTRIGKQGVTNDRFCQNSYLMSRTYLENLRRLETCKAVTEQNDL